MAPLYVRKGYFSCIMTDIIFLGSTFCAIITAYVLAFKVPAYQRFSGKLMAAVMMLFAWSAISYLLIESGLLARLPHLYKTGATVGFLVPPLLYLYVRSVLYDKKHFDKKDLLHFLPFILLTINYLPVYLMPIAEKRIMIAEVISNYSTVYLKDNGYLPDSVVFLLKMLQTISYLVLQFRIVIAFDQQRLELRYHGHTKKVFKWLHSLNWTILASMGGYIILFTIITLDPTSKYLPDAMILPGLLLSLSFFFISTYLLINPEVLFGLPYFSEEATQTSLSQKRAAKSNTEGIELITRYFEQSKPYLNPTLNINIAAIETGLTSREFSFILNQHFNQRFTDFVNHYRIAYVNSKLKNGYLEHYTLESLYREAGFSSKSTFNKAFKKINQCTPSAFIGASQVAHQDSLPSLE